jgi:hypothetical protein
VGICKPTRFDIVGGIWEFADQLAISSCATVGLAAVQLEMIERPAPALVLRCARTVLR